MLVDRLSKALMPVLLLAQIGVANADLPLLKPDPAIPATAVGSVGYSADGLGQDGVGGTVQAEVGAGILSRRGVLPHTSAAPDSLSPRWSTSTAPG